MGWIIAAVIYFLINIAMAMGMQRLAEQKGHRQSAAFWLTLFLEIFGCAYTAALPDLVLRKQNEDLLALLLRQSEGMGE